MKRLTAAQQHGHNMRAAGRNYRGGYTRDELREIKRNSTHCESCGTENPQTHDGYTCCCNQLVCDGRQTHKYGFPDNYVVSCCWAMAGKEFKKQGKKTQTGMYRIG
jgi:hypothetical protein